VNRIAVVVLVLAGCSEQRSLSAEACRTYRGQIEAVFAARCTSCHGGATPAGSYDLTSYLGALGNGTDATPNAVAGDPSSRILTILGEPDHADVADTLPALTSWVVDCSLADTATSIHAAGILNVASSDFHGQELQRRNWNFSLCAGCHGDDFTGGKAGVACTSCHKDGPTACTTCHGSGPTTNAHVTHRTANVACAECHVVPQSWDQDGHILHDGVAITTPAKITFGARANITVDAADRAGPPTFDGTTCSNVYCHGDVIRAGGVATKPAWTDPITGACDRCHGNPPPSHAQTNCKTCHPPDAPHIDGIVQIGRTPGCSGCHGSADSPAPPTDLSGNIYTTAIGVGAHQAHLQAPSKISPPVPCNACHLVPVAITDAGHIDSPPPAEVNASLSWDRDAQTCATAWCHGSGRPRWTGANQVFCGSCHGIPPSDSPHTPDMTLTACVTCHPGTVDAFGQILVGGKHLNGSVDLQ
jgi:predicted CxxxxCH...CXXCH cytochrome family protein